MGILTYGIRFICDLCGTTADAPAPAEGPIRYDQIPGPDGWTNMALLLIQVRDFYGAPLTYLCPACSALTIAETVERMRTRAEQARVA